MASVTLCMVVKNESLLIQRAIASVESIVEEIIVVDTGSSDGTRKLAKAAGARVLRYEWDGSLGRARNLYIGKATCDWILVLDGDESIARKDLPGLSSLARQSAVTGVHFTVREYSDQLNLLNSWRANDGRYSSEERFSRSPGFSEDRIFRMFRRVPELRYDEGFSVHTNPKRSLRAYRDGFRESPAIIHHFHSLKGGGAFILNKQAERLRNEIRHTRLFPRDHWNHYNVAIGHFSLSQDEEALAAATKAVKLDPTCYRNWLLVGFIRKELGRYKLAERAIERCKSIAPSRPEAWVLLGMIADADDRAEDAESFLRKAISLNASHPLALNSLGVVLERRGKLAQAAAYYARALKVLPSNPLFQENMVRLKKARERS